MVRYDIRYRVPAGRHRAFGAAWATARAALDESPFLDQIAAMRHPEPTTIPSTA